MKNREKARAVRPGEIAVKQATGRSWNDWFQLLDAARGARLSHRAIAAHLVSRHRLGPWWSQMVAVAYEQERGLRELYQAADGFQVSVSKTVAAPLAALFGAWKTTKARQRWLTDPEFTVRKANREKSLRITWKDGRTELAVNFLAKDQHRSQVTVQHRKLKAAVQVERWRAYWRRNLLKLARLLEEADVSRKRS